MVIHGAAALWTCPAMAAPTMTNAHPLTLVPALPAPALRATRVVVADDGAVVLEARTAGREARCPVCHQLTARVQSRYRRTLADLSAQGAPVRVRLEVRRFRCATHGCARRIFTERLAPFAAPYARRTTRLQPKTPRPSPCSTAPPRCPACARGSTPPRPACASCTSAASRRSSGWRWRAAASRCCPRRWSRATWRATRCARSSPRCSPRWRSTSPRASTTRGARCSRPSGRSARRPVDGLSRSAGREGVTAGVGGPCGRCLLPTSGRLPWRLCGGCTVRRQPRGDLS